MTFHLRDGHCCIKHCWSVCEQNNIVTSVRLDHWTPELSVIACNAAVQNW